jgi:osmotically inducible protein OsmC
MTMALAKVLYTARVTSTGGREAGHSRSSDGMLELTLTVPKELGGDGTPGTNPEQLFAAGYSSCFLASIKVTATRQQFAVPADASITAEVGVGPIAQSAVANSLSIRVTLDISLPGMDTDVSQRLVRAAHQVCPYSNATLGNTELTLRVNGTQLE